MLAALRYYCWSCYIDNGEQNIFKSVRPGVDALTWHWFKSHCNNTNWAWQKVAEALPNGLATKLFGIDLELWFLPGRDPKDAWSSQSAHVWASTEREENFSTRMRVPSPL